jgi:hypothetical protein
LSHATENERKDQPVIKYYGFDGSPKRSTTVPVKRRPRYIGSFGLLWLAVLLGSCGGGDGGGLPPPPKSQAIAFAQAGPLYKFLGDTAYSNQASGGGGTGAINYSSDAPSVATVDSASGEVTIVGLGSAKIAASKAADASFLAAQANYTLQVAPRSVNLTAWIGPTDTQVEFAALPFALDFARASDLHCDPTTVLTCLNGAQTQTSSAPLLDASTTLTQPSMYWLKHGPNISAGIALPEQKFHANTVGGTVVFNGRLWIVTSGYVASNEVWSSSDGANWQLEAANVAGGPQTETHLLLNNNALWIIVGSTTACQVWRSVDGKSWAQVTNAANFPGRLFFAAAAFNGRLWVMGGAIGVDPSYNDLWSSSDGITWVENNAAVFPNGRQLLELTAFNGRLWAIGGYNAGVAYADVWSSPDGATWIEETADAAYGPRFAERVITDGTQLWLIGGMDGFQSAHPDVWSSPDGKNWSLVTNAAEFWFGTNHGAAWWNGAFWVVAAGSSEVWRSPTATHWNKVSLNARIPGESAQSATAFQGRVWVVGIRSELWSSADGLNWTLDTPQLPGSAVYPQLVALPDRLILITGWLYSAPNYYREVWQSTDGGNWSKVSGSVPFRSEVSFQTLVLNGKLWVFGSNVSDGITPEIWSSSDGLHWTLVGSNPAFTPRWAYQAIAYAGKLFVVAGSNSNGPLSDVWTSTDGAAWTQLSATTGLRAANYATSLALNNAVCVYGGAGYDGWCSTDGSAWTQLTDNAPIGPTALLNGTAYAVGTVPSLNNVTDLVWKTTDGGVWRLGYQNSLQFP